MMRGTEHGYGVSIRFPEHPRRKKEPPPFSLISLPNGQTGGGDAVEGRIDHTIHAIDVVPLKDAVGLDPRRLAATQGMTAARHPECVGLLSLLHVSQTCSVTFIHQARKKPCVYPLVPSHGPS